MSRIFVVAAAAILRLLYDEFVKEVCAMISYKAIRKNKTLLQVIPTSEKGKDNSEGK